MKVVILNTADAHGGAAIASWRLLHALAGEGVDARMLVVDRTTADPLVDVAGTAEQRRWALLRERIGIFAANGLNRRDLFKVSTARYGVDVLSHPWLRSADVVCLNWINHGMLSLTDVGRLAAMGKRLVWTLHDGWTLTGHCALFSAIGCNGWESGCERCHHIGEYPRCVTKGHSARNFALKRLTFSGVERLRIVTPSQWLGGLVKRSYLGDYEMTVIPNGVDLDRFKPRENDVKARLGIEGRTMLLGVASKWLSVKGLDDFVALAQLLGEEYAIVMVGVDERLRQRLPGRIIALPHTESVEELAELYTAADLLLNLSREESFGLVSLEALACGTPVLTYDCTAAPEVLRRHAGECDCGIIVRAAEGVTAVAVAIEAGQWREITAEQCTLQAAGYSAKALYARYLSLYE